MQSGISAHELLRARGEIIFRFKKPVHLSIGEISRNLSIDDFQNDTIIAYANEKGFNWFSRLNIPFDVLEPPSLNKGLITAMKVNAPDFYPSYEEYLSIMNSYASEYPDICNLVDFGSTVDGRRLLAVKISDNPDEREQEPVVFYTASMHGDEPLGFVVLLKLIDYLLPEYYSNAEIKDLINQTEIYINPLANPDGAYYISDTSIIGSIRFNKNQVDLNRDFPEVPFDTRDSADLQPETLQMMNFMKDIRPSLAANFHSGAELVNYPWDTWTTYHSDDSWYRKISRKYADTAQAYSPDGYMTSQNNGITRGIEWYQVYGSRQDYVNYYLYGREVTIELSNPKIPQANQIADFWNYNRKSLVQYISNALTGFTGTVTDSATGKPLYARIRIINHDRIRDNSYVFTRAGNGNYFRLINEGTYQVVFSATGHMYKIASITVKPGELTRLDMALSTGFTIKPFPNPFSGAFRLDIPYSGYMLDITFIDLSGRKVKIIRQPVETSGVQFVETDGLAAGYYFIHVTYNNQTWLFKGIKAGP